MAVVPHTPKEGAKGGDARGLTQLRGWGARGCQGTDLGWGARGGDAREPTSVGSEGMPGDPTRVRGDGVGCQGTDLGWGAVALSR